MSVCQGKTQTSHMLEGHLLPSEVQELGRRWSKGVSSAPGPLAALPGLCSMRPPLGPARVHQALLCPGPCHSLRPPKICLWRQQTGPDPRGLSSVCSEAKRFARLRFELELTPVQNPTSSCCKPSWADLGSHAEENPGAPQKGNNFALREGEKCGGDTSRE